MTISRLTYYLRSIPTLLLRIRQPWATLALFLGLPIPKPRQIFLRTGLTFKIRTPMDVWIIKETCLDRDYERGFEPLKNGWRVLDIGAGLGDFTVLAAKNYPQSRVFAYEPFPESYHLLQENLALNGLKNVQTYPHAVGSRRGELYLNIATGVPVLHSSSETPATAESVPVQSLTLDEVITDMGGCDFLKMDCEGAEYDILFSASPATLAQIQRISLEYHEHTTPHTHGELVSYLEKHGFQVQTSVNPVHHYTGFLRAWR